MLLIGLTGGIATGKSTVANKLRDLGIVIIDADVIAREVVEPGKPAWKKIKAEFGEEILLPNGELNRPLLGEVVFSEPDKRRKLNSITHPQIYKEIFWKCLKMLISGHQYVILDLPLLFESGKMVKYVSKVIVVTCDENQQLERLMMRNNFTRNEAENRISAQLSLQEKCQMADFVIDNSGDINQTHKQVHQVVSQLNQSYGHWKLRGILLGATLTFCGLVTWSLIFLSQWLTKNG
ncbi:uncharacterized protein LOC106463026 [Limulus polyphemus]|uniref:Uncharacterized protein LOC106463026 n=1 Tax=Limulus polyphemus TaxID=6850 RepID=A0ABM1BB46_LIMPO|nr:uncharacterized protein LOC106463026 [Limulus polyphemus]